jgi:hypothetical protein
MRRGIAKITAVGLLLLGVVSTASASTVIISSGSATAQAALAGDLSATLSIDIRGAIVFEVFDPASLGLVAASDLGAPTPNPLLVGTSSSQSAALTFDTTAPLYSLMYDTLVLPVAITPVGMVSDPALVAFLGDWLATFTIIGAAGDPGAGFVFDYGLIALDPVLTATPEPTTMVLAAVGFCALGLIRRRIIR